MHESFGPGHPCPAPDTGAEAARAGAALCPDRRRALIQGLAPVLASALTLGLGARAQPAQATEALRVVTEEMPPYNMQSGGQLTGVSTEIVQAVLREAGLEASFELLPWARAYELAQVGENVLIYSIARTPQREKMFKWVGAIAPLRWALYARADRGIRLQSLEQARGLQIATVNEDAGEQYLVARGFVIGRQLQSSARYDLNLEKLRAGRVDLWISTELTAAWQVRSAADRQGPGVVKVLELQDVSSSDGLYMALSLRTPDATAEKLRRALEQLRRNGSLNEILRRWL